MLLRAQTNLHKQSPDGKIENVQSLHQFVWKNALKADQDGDIGQFKMSDICNVAQSSLLFAFLSGKTRAMKQYGFEALDLGLINANVHYR